MHKDDAGAAEYRKRATTIIAIATRHDGWHEAEKNKKIELLIVYFIYLFDVISCQATSRNRQMKVWGLRASNEV